MKAKEYPSLSGQLFTRSKHYHSYDVAGFGICVDMAICSWPQSTICPYGNLTQAVPDRQVNYGLEKQCADRQSQKHHLMTELTIVKSKIFLHQTNVGLPILPFLMTVHHFWTSDCPDGDAGNMANPYKLTVWCMSNKTKWNEAMTWDGLIHSTAGNCGNSLLFYFFIYSGKYNFTFQKFKKVQWRI